MKKCGERAEITRFKGLGEISPDEFSFFIGDDMRIDPVVIGREANIQEMLGFFMGKNTPDRQKFIIDNLRVDKDDVDVDEDVDVEVDVVDDVEEALEA